jgi:hypothetical protein
MTMNVPQNYIASNDRVNGECRIRKKTEILSRKLPEGKGKGKVIPVQAVEALRVARG